MGNNDFRSQMQTKAQTHQSGQGSSSSSHPMMSQSGSSSSSHPMMGSQSGGRRRRRRSRRAGIGCSTKAAKGGMKMGRSKAAKGGMKMGRSKARRGGMGAMGGFGAVIKEALVPFGLFAFQKRTQKKRHHGKNKSHRRRR